jgi:hypothetical protein
VVLQQERGADVLVGRARERARGEGAGRKSVRAVRSGTDGARDALQVHVKTCDQADTRHGAMVPQACVTLEDVSAVLTSRRHVDLKRTASAVCS